MTGNELQKKTKNEISKDFRTAVTQLENDLSEIADGENIVAGTGDNPIVTNSHVLPIEHFFMEGVYIRKMTMHKGVTVIGAIHKHLHMCFLTEGHLVVADESGTKEYKAPCHIIATPGVKRVLYALEHSVWYNTHKNPTDTENVREIEENTVALNYEEYDEYIKNK
jgi:hypothetical protein